MSEGETEVDSFDEEYIPLALPQHGDPLFVQDRKNWRMDAMMNVFHGDSYAYREGYRMAGRILTESSAQRGWVDLLVYPICHSYRHYVELTLKHLMALGCRVIQREMTPTEAGFHANSHDLGQLWACFKRIEKEVSNATGESYPKNEIDGIGAYIEQLHKVDNGSYSFRYARNKVGDVSLGSLERINLAQFSELMERLGTALEYIDSYYGQMLSAMADMYSHCSQY